MAKRGMANTRFVIDADTLMDFVNEYFSGRHTSFLLPNRNQNALNMPNGFVNICAADDWITIANRPKIECIIKGGVDLRDWKDEFCLYERIRLKVQKNGFFGDDIPKDDCGAIYDILKEEGFVVHQYPEGISYKAGLIPALAEGGEEFDDMSYLQYVKKGTKEVSEMPNPNASAAGGSVGERTGESSEVVSRPPSQVDAIDVDALPDARKKRANMPPPGGGSIAARMKRGKIVVPVLLVLLVKMWKKVTRCDIRH
uniref:uncharacterized protein LOC122609074 n=1 Tax=Erigeron canadensis TaxID=72917 RepID=UPI001CB8D4CD|nr:uncharacterized protein LOC122609074 [Erigeron canadensis]